MTRQSYAKPWDNDGHSLTAYDGGRKLCFGIMWHDGYVKPHPPIIRALKETTDAVEKMGHKGERLVLFCIIYRLTDILSDSMDAVQVCRDCG